jgi:hypothetical protein
MHACQWIIVPAAVVPVSEGVHACMPAWQCRVSRFPPTLMRCPAICACSHGAAPCTRSHSQQWCKTAANSPWLRPAMGGCGCLHMLTCNARLPLRVCGCVDGDEVVVSEEEVTTYVLSALAAVRQREKQIIGRTLRLLYEE